MRKNRRQRKEEIAEDWCFVCKEGGLLILCDHKDCLKSYHPHCVGKDASVVDSQKSWKCDWHSCCLCKKAAKFHCFCCPTAICGRCIEDLEFVVYQGIKGFCINCLRLALLWEEKKDVDSNGLTIDFTRKTIEGLFIEYWQILKEKEDLKLEDLQEAWSLLIKGQNYRHSQDTTDFSQNDLDSLDLADYDDWEFEKIEDYSPSKRETKRKRSKSLNNRTIVTLKSKKRNAREFSGWGSKALIEFLTSINEDTSVELTQYDVTNIVTRYVDQKNLFDQQRKKMVVCDQTLQALLGKKMVNKNRLYSLLEPHFASNVDESEVDHHESSSQEDDDDKEDLITYKRKKIKHHDVPLICGKVVHRSDMAAVVTENLRLVYLKKILVEELLKDEGTFEGKVVGGFVRVKSDPNDYMQKNSHQLVQIIAVKKRPVNGVDTTMLQVSNMPDDVDMKKLSDSDFTKEELEQLSQQMKDGLHKKPTVVELERKAKILHEDITKHWIKKELALLKNRIDMANEKGWKRELADYTERRRLLLEPSEQSRLIQEIPQVIAEELEINENSNHDKERRKSGNDLPCSESMGEGGSGESGDISAVTKLSCVDNVDKMAIRETIPDENNIAALKLEDHDTTIPPEDEKPLPGQISPTVGPQHKQKDIEVIDLDENDDDKKTRIGTTCPTEIELSEQSRLIQEIPQVKAEEVEINVNPIDDKERRKSGNDPCGESMEEGDSVHSGDTNAGIKSTCDNSVKKTAIRETMARKNNSAAPKLEDHASAILSEDQKPSPDKVSPPVTPQHKQEPIEIIDLDDDDDGNEVAENMKIVTPCHTETKSTREWFCMGPLGDVRGPYDISFLRTWNQITGNQAIKFKVWKRGQCSNDAIPLPQACGSVRR